MKKILALFSLCLLCISPPPAGQSRFQELDSVLTTLANKEMFNGQVLLAEKDQVVFYDGYGTYNDRPVSPNTLLPIASVSKPITAVGIIILNEQGKLDYDDKITEQLPEIPYPNITIRQLLNQTSGIPNFLSTAIEYGNTTRVMNKEEIFELVRGIKPPAGTAEEQFFYNNTNYLLYRRIIEKVSGISYEDFMNQNIWEPLEMKYTQIDKNAHQTETQINASNFYNPDSGINSTVEDIFRFAQVLTSNTLISQKTLYEAFSQTILNDGAISIYGLGWYILETPESKSVGHWGGAESIKAYLEMYLTEEKKLVILSAVLPDILIKPIK